MFMGNYFGLLLASVIIPLAFCQMLAFFDAVIKKCIVTTKMRCNHKNDNYQPDCLGLSDQSKAIKIVVTCFSVYPNTIGMRRNLLKSVFFIEAYRTIIFRINKQL